MFEQALGLDDSHINYGLAERPIHNNCADALARLRAAAQHAGFELRLASGFRSFSQQLTIWNAKARGERRVLDSNEQPIDIVPLADAQKMFAILRWSALPGTSRHHFGTDWDVYAENLMPANYRLQLTQEEYIHGVQKEFNRWLTEFLRTDGEFARPFEQASSGVAAEPWHISYLPQARQLEPWVKRDNVLAALEQADIELKKQIQQQLPTILAEYVRPV
ncbi:MAG TPA: M15 family metallopeptidase [Cellvibrionaceae bacterium]|nr:M15 family metallopeptidase [Cellvibrionaceae bacterium]